MVDAEHVSACRWQIYIYIHTCISMYIYIYVHVHIYTYACIIYCSALWNSCSILCVCACCMRSLSVVAVVVVAVVFCSIWGVLRSHMKWGSINAKPYASYYVFCGHAHIHTHAQMHTHTHTRAASPPPHQAPNDLKDTLHPPASMTSRLRPTLLWTVSVSFKITSQSWPGVGKASTLIMIRQIKTAECFYGCVASIEELLCNVFVVFCWGVQGGGAETPRKNTAPSSDML